MGAGYQVLLIPAMKKPPTPCLLLSDEASVACIFPTWTGLSGKVIARGSSVAGTMRIERKGPVAKLTPRLERFFIEALGGESLDDMMHAEARKADFRCLRGLLAIELKTLKQDASQRIDNLTSELSQCPDWPLFFGSVPIESALKHVRDPEKVKRRFVDRIGRAVKDHVSKADKQLAAHEAAFPRKNMLRVMVLANEDHAIYDPAMVAYLTQRHLLRQENGSLLYPHIDAVIFITERHATAFDDQIAFPILCIDGHSMTSAPWKSEVINMFMARWARWNGGELYYSDLQAHKFQAVDHIPEHMKRYEHWELEYKRMPYMAGFTVEQLRERFDEIFCISSLRFIKDSPLKPSDDAVNWSLSSMSHITLEMGWRGIPLTQFMYEAKRLAAAARRLHLPCDVVEWFENDMGRAV